MARGCKSVQIIISEVKHRYSDRTIIQLVVCFIFISSFLVCVFLFMPTVQRDLFFDILLSRVVVHISIFSKKVVCIVYKDGRRAQLPLALQCCSNGKCAYARRSHPRRLHIFQKRLGQVNSLIKKKKKKWNNTMQMVIVKLLTHSPCCSRSF